MIGKLAAVSALALAGEPSRRRHRKRPGSPIAGLGIAFGVGIMTISSLTHHFTVGLFVLMPLFVAAIIAIGWGVQAATRRQAINHVIQYERPKPRVASAGELREQAAQLRRLKRVAALVTPRCTLCGSLPGVSCGAVPNVAVYKLDGPRALYAHAVRIAQAVRNGQANIQEVAAQFAGRVPDEIWELTL